MRFDLMEKLIADWSRFYSTRIIKMHDIMQWPLFMPFQVLSASLECGYSCRFKFWAPLWSAAAWRRFVID